MFTPSEAAGNSKYAWIVGAIFISFAVPMIWMTERVNAIYYKMMMAGKNAFMNVDSEKPFNNEWDLVYCTGRTATTQTPVEDQMFGVSFQDIVKIKRTVEVYQWV